MRSMVGIALARETGGDCLNDGIKLIAGFNCIAQTKLRNEEMI